MAMSAAIDPQAAAVLDFWFGAPDSSGALKTRPEWFRKDEAFDASIRERFGATIEAALAGGLRDWDETPDGALARVIVLDQFTRNAFRGTPRAFAGDALALQAARAMVARGDDARVAPLRRQFVYLPFEHSEDRAMQAESLRLFEALALGDLHEWARRHAVIVERFGRFPHRNAILGRQSTPEEIEFLKQPGSGF
jgi:uncharacterized protein (DUF924 family)